MEFAIKSEKVIYKKIFIKSEASAHKLKYKTTGGCFKMSDGNFLHAQTRAKEKRENMFTNTSKCAIMYVSNKNK